MRTRSDIIAAWTFILLSIPVGVILGLAGTKMWLIVVVALILVAGGILLLAMAPKERRLTGRDHKWRPLTPERLKRRYQRWRHERQFHRIRSPRK